MTLFSAEAIFASSTSKSGPWIPLTEHEDLNSSTESTISTSFDPQHSFQRKLWTNTYLSLESYLPTSKRGWCREVVKMRIWNLQSLLVCLKIVLKSSLTGEDWISGWRSGLASLILNWCLAFTHQMWWCVFWYIRDPWVRLLRIRCWRRRCWICKKRFPIYHACPKYLAAYRCGSAFPENGLAFRQDLEKVRKSQVDR